MKFFPLALILLTVTFTSSCNRESDPYVARVGSVSFPGTPWHRMWIFADENLKKSNGPLSFDMYLSGELGTEEYVYSQIRRGRTQIGGFSLQGSAAVVPEISLLLSPYLFDSYEEVDFITDNYIGPFFDELFAEKGLVILSWSEVGWTSYYATKPFSKPSDLAGRKLRSSKALSSQVMIDSIDGNAVPLPFPDIIPSLQTGLIDGGESSSIFYALVGTPKEAPYLTLTKHAFDTGLIIGSKTWLESLSPEAQQSLYDALMPLEQSRKMVRSYAQDLLANPEKFGIKKLHELTNEELALWKEATKDNHKVMIKRIGGRAQELYDLIQQGKSDFLAKNKSQAATNGSGL